MYEQVKNIPYETIFNNANSNPTPSEVSLNSNNSDYSSMNLENCDQSNVLQYMEIFFENLKTSTKPFINNLRVMHLFKFYLISVCKLSIVITFLYVEI